MRNDEFCLREILAAAEQLERLRGRENALERFREDREFRHSVFFEFIAIGEHAGGVSAELRERYPAIPWSRITAFRHRVAHGYFDLSLGIVEEIWTQQIPELRRGIAAILAAADAAEAG